jgi:arylsulfatase A-like enzyme
LSHEGVAKRYTGESSEVTVNAALEFIERHAEGEDPFFAVVWFGSPHNPHSAIERDRELYSDQKERLQHFYGEITGMDRAFGRLRDGLRELGIHEETLLWYCSDNGGLPNLGSTGGRGNKGDIYEGGLRVPAFIEWPGHIGKERISELPCCTYDIYPTLLDLVGVEIENQPPLDGISLLPELSDPMASRGKPMGFWDYPSPGIRTPSAELMGELLEAQNAGKEITGSEALRSDAADTSKQYSLAEFPGHAAWLDWPWKLHRIEKEGEAQARMELYQLETDPRESKDLSDSEPERLNRMRKELEDWQTSVVRSLNGEDY